MSVFSIPTRHCMMRSLVKSARLSTTTRSNQTANIVNYMKGSGDNRKDNAYTLPHPIWSREETENVKVTHRTPSGVTDHLAYLSVNAVRLAFDILSGYKIQRRIGTLDEKAVLTRFLVSLC